MFSLSDKRVLCDATGAPVLGMARKHMTLKATWVIYRGGNFTQQVATVKANFGLTPCECAQATARKHVQGHVHASSMHAIAGASSWLRTSTCHA